MITTSPDRLAQNAEAAASVSAATNGHEAALEMKLDGIRLLAHVDENGSVKTYTRTGKSATGKLPQVEAELARLLPPDSWVDGEAVALEMRADGSVTHNWGAAQSCLGSGAAKAALQSAGITYMVFDILAAGGHDARSLPLRSRRKLLEQVFEGETTTAVQLAPQYEATQASHDAIIAAGFEGSMIKWLDAPYHSGKRHPSWRKIKAEHSEDVIITGYQEGEGKYAGQVGAVLFSQIDADGALVYKGKCSGMSDAQRAEISADRAAWMGRVIEVTHNGVMPTGGWRHPRWIRVRDDKLPTQCLAS